MRKQFEKVEEGDERLKRRVKQKSYQETAKETWMAMFSQIACHISLFTNITSFHVCNRQIKQIIFYFLVQNVVSES